MSDTKQINVQYPWLREGIQYLGLREKVGAETNPTIKQWLTELDAWWLDDETPWCGTYVAHCLKATNFTLPTHWYRARDYLNYGVPLDEPVEGSICVFERSGGGHVGFCVGVYKDYLEILGGNQGNEVSIKKYGLDNFLGARWVPDYYPIPSK